MQIICIAMLTIFCACTAFAAEPLLGGVPQSEIDRVAAMLGDKPFAFGPAIGNREAWDKLAKHKAFSNVISRAQKYASDPMPEMTEEIYCEYKKTGERTKHYGDVRYARHNRIAAFALAECIEDKGRFIAPLEAAIKSICAEPTWVFNFHDPNLTDWQGKTLIIDLGSINPAYDMAQTEYLMGEKLSPEVRALMRKTCRDRILTPYRQAVAGETRQWWMTNPNNWNSVCHAGVVGTALVFAQDRQERAFFVAAAEKYTGLYAKGFGPDAYCQEGMGYWGYGFGNYIQLAELIYQATGGKLDLYAIPGVREVALYPVRALIQNGVWPAYADCAVDAKPPFQLMSYLNRRYELGLKDWPNDDFTTAGGGFAQSMMYSNPNSATARPQPDTSAQYHELRTFFKQYGVINLRPARDSQCRMAASIKGGHNGEAHGHTDMGTFVVVLGKEPLVLDPGLEVYTARTFSKDRYKSKLLNSWGHPVPFVAGQLQTPGEKFHATILSTSFTDAADTCTMDLKDAYSIPALTKLQRRFEYRRTGEGEFSVSDDFAFTSAQRFGTALITYGQWQQQPDGSLLIHRNGEAIRVTLDAGGASMRISSEVIQENNGRKEKPTRIGIDLAEPAASGQITLTFVPAKADALLLGK